MIFAFLWLVFLVSVVTYTYLEFKRSTYHLITGNSFLGTYFDKGKWGEYLSYANLKRFEKQGARFLFNLYIPKTSGETTELDVVMIWKSGIYVIESKNYSGWIFGNEKQPYWTQTLPVGRKSQKERFYNPVIQNKGHIKHLRKIIGDETQIHSLIAFSDRCTLKNITICSNDVFVINRSQIAKVVSQIANSHQSSQISENGIEEIYGLLYPFSQTTQSERDKHISDIREKRTPSTERTCVVDADPEGRQSGNAPLQSELNELTCPRCGSELVLRTARKGERKGMRFYGCKNYPNCRYIRDIK